jgi:glutamate racemase
VSEAAVGVLAEGAGGMVLARAIQARLPKEDVTVLADHAYAPYARRSAHVVTQRAPALAAELAADGIKLLVVASLQMGEDALAPIAAAAGVPTLALDATLPYAARRSSQERIAALWADGTLRAVPWLKRHAFERGGREVVALPWPGLAEAIEAGRHPDPASVPTVPDDCVVALLDPYASTQAARFADPVDCAAVTADRVHRQLVRMQALARRRRPGRILLRSSHPVRAQAALPVRRPSPPA